MTRPKPEAKATRAGLELRALAELGLGAPAETVDDADGELPIDRLVRIGKIARHQALAARALVAAWSEPGDARSAEDEPAGAAPLGPGARIGPYEVVRALGHGSSGTVYEVRHAQIGRRSALKVVPGAHEDVERRTRFEREVQALARVQSPNVVKIHALVPLEGALAYEMELVEGETLATTLARDGALRPRAAVALIAGLARGMERVHALGIMHRDLKPANVIIEHRGAPSGRPDAGRGVIVDFGLARLVSVSSLTKSGTLLGTPLYMAPEALSGSGATASSDVYALGAILHEAVTGRPPFCENTLAALLNKVTRGECAPLPIPELEAIRAKAMAPDPAKRHASMEQLASDLEALLEAVDARAHAGSPHSEWDIPMTMREGVPGGPPDPRRALLVTGGVAALVCFVLGGVLVARRSGSTSNAPGTGVPTPPTVERALDVDGAILALRAEGGARAPALAALVEAIAAARPAERRPIEEKLGVAIAAVPSSAELRTARARLAMANGAPLRAEDLAAAGVALAPGAKTRDFSIDALAAHGLERGVDGTEAAAVAARLAAERPESRAVAELAGVLAATSGDPARRAEAVRWLGAARPRSEHGVALARALALADEVAAKLQHEEDVSSAAERLAVELTGLQRTPRLAGAASIVLDPVAAALLEIWRGLKIDFATRSRELAAVLEVLACGDAVAPPRVLALRAVLLYASTNHDPQLARGLGLERLAGAARALVAEEPLLAAASLDAAIRRDESGAASVEALRARLAALEVADEAFAAATRRGFPSESEASTATITGRRLAQSRALAEEALAAEDEPAARRGHLERALAARRHVLALAKAEPILARLREDDARAVLWCLFALDRTEDWDPIAREITDGSIRQALGAEVLRRRGDAKAARELALRAVAAQTGAPDPVAALARVEADLRNFEEARRLLGQLRPLDQKAPPVIEAFRPFAVEEHLKAAEGRR